jgi:hypothetical protein
VVVGTKGTRVTSESSAGQRNVGRDVLERGVHGRLVSCLVSLLHCSKALMAVFVAFSVFSFPYFCCVSSSGAPHRLSPCIEHFRFSLSGGTSYFGVHGPQVSDHLLLAEQTHLFLAYQNNLLLTNQRKCPPTTASAMRHCSASTTRVGGIDCIERCRHPRQSRPYRLHRHDSRTDRKVRTGRQVLDTRWMCETARPSQQMPPVHRNTSVILLVVLF